MPPSVNPRFCYVLNVSSKLVGDGKCGKKTWQLYVLRFSCLFLATLARQSSGGKVCRSVDWPPWSHWNISTTIGQGVTVFKHKYNMSHSNLKWGLWVHNQDPQMFLTCLPVSPQLRKLWFLRYACFLFTVCVCVWEGLCPWENEFRWKQTSESVSRQRFKSLLADNDDEHHVVEGVDWYQTDGGLLVRLHDLFVMYCTSQRRYHNGTWWNCDKAEVCMEMWGWCLMCVPSDWSFLLCIKSRLMSYCVFDQHQPLWSIATVKLACLHNLGLCISVFV